MMMKKAFLVLLFVSAAHADTLKPSPAWSKDATTWDSGAYVYDAAGNIRAVGADVYTYDAFGRLKSATAITPSSPGNVEVFEYDPYGNMLKDTRTSSVGTEILANAVDPFSNRLKSGPCPAPNTRCYTGAYDAAGNQTGAVAGVVQYQWDALGMMTDQNLLDRPEEYVYDANDERIVTVGKNGGLRRFTFRGADNKVSREVTYDPQSGTWKWMRDYVYRNGLLYAEYLANEPGPGPHRHYHLDHLGTPRLITDSAGYKHSIHTYWAFGQEAAGSEIDPGERMAFTGHELDSNPAAPGEDLYYMHARYDSAFTERFLSPDPTWNSADLRSPQSWNRYAYVLNNPMARMDPDGRCSLVAALFGGIGCGVEAIAKGAVQDYSDAKEAIEGMRHNASTKEKVMGGAVLILITAKYATVFMGGGEGAAAGAESRAAAAEATEVEGAVAGSIRNVNPTGSTMNCVNCAATVDNLLATGRPASALPSSVARPISVLGDNWASMGSQANVTSAMSKAGSGARGIVFVNSAGSDVGHVFNVVNQNGVIRYLDGQTGKAVQWQKAWTDVRLLLTN